MDAKISSIESFATLDGIGVRYAIFFSGCNLRCNFCHNPETWDINNGSIVTATELLNKILRYVPYFGSDGGVTLSGGEPLLQTKFLLEFVPMLKQHTINVTLDTAGSLLNADVKKLLNMIDLVILDLKHNTYSNYARYANGSLDDTIAFLSYLNHINKPTWIRTVIVPYMNDTKTDIENYIKLISPYTCVQKYELLGFHTMGFVKYKDLKLPNPLTDIPAFNIEKLADLQEYADSVMNKKTPV